MLVRMKLSVMMRLLAVFNDEVPGREQSHPHPHPHSHPQSHAETHSRYHEYVLILREYDHLFRMLGDTVVCLDDLVLLHRHHHPGSETDVHPHHPIESCIKRLVFNDEIDRALALQKYAEERDIALHETAQQHIENIREQCNELASLYHIE